jgi:hypothetical protein
MLDAPSADPGWRDPYVHVAGAVRPGLQMRRALETLNLVLAGDRVRAAPQQHAPAFMPRLVEAVGLEADRPVYVRHATRMLAAGLDQCRGLGLDRVLLTCDTGYEPSRRVILANGVPDGHRGGEDHFWIDLGRA